jgi:hypothetical protein
MTQSTTDAAASGAAFEKFHLVSVIAVSPPSGSVGNDWFMYRIAQGANFITGYRRGSEQRATADVEGMVEAFNERLLVKTTRPRWSSRSRKPVPAPKALV